MFYNSKKLIDEKVLQQYYFEKFMLATSTERKKLLPKKFHQYSNTEIIKGLNPEVSVGEKTNGGKHTTDFVLYPMPKSELPKLNIEIKWNIVDFIKQPERFPHYNGEITDGFAVAVKVDDDVPETIDDGQIPVVYLDAESFKQWFTKKAHLIISQSLSNKLNIPPSRLTGEKFWVITVVDKSLKHYIEHGRKQEIWAFRDNNNPKNIMNILDGDYVIFIHYKSCMPGRCAYPFSDNPNKKFPKSRGGDLLSNEITWTIDMIDIKRVSKGYHLNYTDKAPYHGFDEEWISQQIRFPENKDYTQFITFKKELNEWCYLWNRPINEVLDRTLFNEVNEGLSEFVNASRASMNTRGDAIEISRLSFESLSQLLSEY